MTRRPAHLSARQATGRAFSETARLERATTEWDDDSGEHRTVYDGADLRCSTAPPGAGRDQTEAGVGAEGLRTFWLDRPATAASLAGPGDVIVWQGQRWRVAEIDDWGAFIEARAVRQEPQ